MLIKTENEPLSVFGVKDKFEQDRAQSRHKKKNATQRNMYVSLEGPARREGRKNAVHA